MRLRQWIPFLLATGLILIYSTDFYTRDFVYVGDMVSSVEDEALATDLWTAYNKSRHLVAFLVLGLAAFPLRKQAHGFRRALLLCALVGSFSEFVQLFSQTHHAKVSDIMVDVVAATMGLRLLFAPPAFLQKVPWRAVYKRSAMSWRHAATLHLTKS